MSPWCMPWCECPLGSMPRCECPLGHVMMQMLWCRHNLFKNSLYFQNEAFSATEIKNIFKSWFIISRKVIFLFFFLFWLKAPKKLVIIVRNLRIGHLLEIWWSGSKDLFSQIWLSKEMAHFHGLFLEKWILWKSSILKGFIFFVSKYGNLTDVKTHRDRFKNLGKETLV